MISTLGRLDLKAWAIITMTIDHIGFLLFPQISIFRLIGRIAFPLFSYLIVRNIEYTKSPWKYLSRLLIFGLISQIPYFLFLNISQFGSEGESFNLALNIFFALAMGLALCLCLDRMTRSWIYIIPSILILSIHFFVKIDYGIYGLLLMVSLFLFAKYKYKILPSIFILLITLYFTYLTGYTIQLFSLLAIPFIFLNKETYNPAHKKSMFLYWYYPSHILVLLIILYLMYW
jgi:hypothetical protein